MHGVVDRKELIKRILQRDLGSRSNNEIEEERYSDKDKYRAGRYL